MKSGYLRISVSSVGKINHKPKKLRVLAALREFFTQPAKGILLCAGTFCGEDLFLFAQTSLRKRHECCFSRFFCVKKSFVKLRVYSWFFFLILIKNPGGNYVSAGATLISL